MWLFVLQKTSWIVHTISTMLQSSLSPSSIASADANSVQKRAYMESLIDFSVDTEPTVAANPEQSVPQQTTTVASNGGEWAAFNSGQQSVPPNANPLVSGLAQLSVSGLAPSGSISNLPSGIDLSTKVGIGGSLSTATKQHAPLFPSMDNIPTDQLSNASGTESSNNQVEAFSFLFT